MNTLLLDEDVQFLARLEAILMTHWPSTNTVTKCTKYEVAAEELVKQKYDMLFLNIAQFKDKEIDRNKVGPWAQQTIFLADDYEYAATAINCGATGYLLKPLQMPELTKTFELCRERRLSNREANFTNDLDLCLHDDEIICIPTVDGAEFFQPKDIIRCEGLQKCTRIHTNQRSNIVSSYHIGVFRKVLTGLGFIQTHKSHLVNRLHIRKYLREGTIYMSDGSTVPVARRKKTEIFQAMRHPHLMK